MVRIAIVSAGHIHMPGFAQLLRNHKDVQVSGVYDPNPQLAKKYASELQTLAALDLPALLRDDALQAVVIAGTTAQHDALVMAAAEAGKHLFVEKPLATTPRSAARMAEIIRRKHLIFQTGHFLRGTPAHRFLHEEILAGNLGRITRARAAVCHYGAIEGFFAGEFRWFTEPSESGGGGFLDLGCHAMDLLVYLLGPVRDVTGITGNGVRYNTCDEYGEALMQFCNGAIGSICGSWVDLVNPVTLQISGTEGNAAVVNTHLLYRSNKSKVPGADGKHMIMPEHLPKPMAAPLDLFLDVVAGKQERGVLVPIDDALHVTLAMHAVCEASHGFGWRRV